MQDKLSARGRRMVTIVDPHIKRDGGYGVHSVATSKGYYIKNKSGADLDGWCWPGSSSYLDFTRCVCVCARVSLRLYVCACVRVPLYDWVCVCVCLCRVRVCVRSTYPPCQS